MIEFIIYMALFVVGWFILSIVLRRARIWRRQYMLNRLNQDLKTHFTEFEVYGDELKPHI